jgi:tryptophan-rich sensory protein
MNDVPWIDWYQSLAKPEWTLAPRTIGLIWQILYPVIIATFGYVFVQAARGRLPLLVALPFAINLVANLIFGLQPSSNRCRPYCDRRRLRAWLFLARAHCGL